MSEGKQSGPRLLGGHKKLAVGSLLSACALGGSVAAGLTLAGSPAGMGGAHSYRSSLEAAQGRSPLATVGRLSPDGAYFEVPGTLFPYLHWSHLSAIGQQVITASGIPAGSSGASGSRQGGSAGGGSGGVSVPPPPGSVSPGGSGGSGTSPGGVSLPKLKPEVCVPLRWLPLPLQIAAKTHLEIDGIKVQIRHTKSVTEVCGRLPKSLTKKKKHGLPLPGGVTPPTLPGLPAVSTDPTP